MKHLYTWLTNESGTETTLGANETLTLQLNHEENKKSVRVAKVFITERERDKAPMMRLVLRKDIYQMLLIDVKDSLEE